VLDGDPAPPPQRGGGHSIPKFWPMYCHTAAWINMPLAKG